MGSNNEAFVIGALPGFFEKAIHEWAVRTMSTSIFEWVESINVGLVCLKQRWYMGTSVDHLVRVVLKSVPSAVYTIPARRDLTNACAFCTKEATHGFQSLKFVADTCAEHAIEGMHLTCDPQHSATAIQTLFFWDSF